MNTLKKCFKCGEEKNRSDFYKHSQMGDGLLGKCKDCAKKDVLKHREANLEKIQEYDRARQYHPNRKKKLLIYQKKKREKYPEKYHAQLKVNNAIRDGKIKRPSVCSVCGVECIPHAHHWSYIEENWLDVIWVCVNCHLDIHHESRQ